MSDSLNSWDKISQKIAEFEQINDITVLLASEIGVLAKGFSSSVFNSELDVIFIYVHRIDSYSRLESQSETMQLVVSEEIVLRGLELRHAIALLKKAEMSVVDVFMVSVVDICHRHRYFLTLIKDPIRRAYQPEKIFHHCMTKASSLYDEHISNNAMIHVEKYLEIIHSLLRASYLKRKLHHPDIDLDRLVVFSELPSELQAEIKALQVINSDDKENISTIQSVSAVPVLHHFIQTELSRLKTASMDTTVPDFSLLDEVVNDVIIRYDAMSKKDTSIIPKGEYCDGLRITFGVTTSNLCPYWQKTDYGMIRCNYMGLEDLNEFDIIEAQKLAIAHYGSEEAYLNAGYGSALHDEQKICDVNMEWDDDEN